MANQKRFEDNSLYPIGKLDDVEIHFLHYHTEEEASDKWNRRKYRIDLNNLFVEFGQNELVDYDLMKKFDNLKYKNKVILSAKNFKDINSLIWIKDRDKFADVGDIYTNKKIWRKEFDVVKWLNEGIR